jgi:hypothetical protein
MMAKNGFCGKGEGFTGARIDGAVRMAQDETGIRWLNDI